MLRLPRPAVKAAADLVEKAAASRPFLPVPFRGLRMASRICQDSGMVCSPVA
jgi:hypothetical protein